MKKWVISKQFEFCYGHRVWNQILDSEFSIDSKCACRHLHGHQGTILINLKGEELENGMVTDFKHLNWFKKWLDDTLDHKFIMDVNDPLFNHEVPDLDNKRVLINWDDKGFGTLTGYKDMERISDSVCEKYEGMVFVKFVPTSENLSKWLFEIVEEKMKKINVSVEKIEFFETPKSKSTYGY
ncbi:MAG: 6-carboxytetrahydropterin synthase [Bacteroidia bacterium]